MHSAKKKMNTMTARNNTKARPAPPTLTRAEAQRRQREKYAKMSKAGMTVAEMCRAMDTEELSANVRRGGSAAIAEEAYRAGLYPIPDPELDIGV